MTDRDPWADGYAAARRFYGDTAPLALDKIRQRLADYRTQHAHRPPPMFDLDEMLYDLQSILDTAQEPRHD